MRALLRHVPSVAVTALAAAALLLAAVDAPLWVAVVVAMVALAGTLWLLRRRLTRPGTGTLGAYAPARSIVAATVVVCLGRTDLSVADSLAVCATVAALVLVPFEPAAGRLWRAGTRPVAHLPGVELDTPARRRGAATVVLGGTLVLAVSAVSVFVAWCGVVAFVAAFVLAVLTAWWTLDAIRRRPGLRDTIAAGLEAYAAPVMIYLTGPGGTDYQFKVWQDQFENLGLRAVVVVRETPLAYKVAELTSLPVVGASSLADLEAVQVPSFRVALYVNNGTKNTHNIRYGDLTHVQLLHGDSDKPSSFNPVTAMFDKVFVAGQAGIERYWNHGIPIPREKFEIVGRPQVADIALAGERPEGPFTVLYGPTWTGFNADNNFGSLHVGAEIVRGLVRRGWTVIFRPHPFSLRDAASRAHIAAIEEILRADAASSGREHVFGEDASATMTLVDCFNASDALVSDVSSVPADYLYSEKPFVIVQVDDGPVDAFLAEFALGRAAYVARAVEPASIEAALDGLAHDTMADVRREMRTFYLGDIPRETYAEAFPAAVRALVDANPAPAVPTERLDRGEEPTDPQEDADDEDE
ncbi:glycosyl transferase [Luteimicrobium album]|uniref:Glycosyl transferase n=1 Tax=Luteimicrobium album TaxID=1054550 RepID=A0ABQ6I2U4_9MICO|nr:CDP-glycerol glycerophosphotransferase family protein [Luteimicrobium album]GMA25093.1 glycosyl transferase [Luteimicrobium album]